MIETLRGWLLGLISVSLACALAGALMPSGAVKRVGRLVCGLAMMLAILAPLARVDVASGEDWVEQFLSQTRQREEELEEQVGEQLKVIIEQRCAAYIVDKAALLGLTCSAQVECQEAEGTYLPVRAVVVGSMSETDRVKLWAVIIQDLGIPEEEITMEEEMQ